MQAIAMLLHDDPYLKLTAQQRCDARRERKDRFSRTIEHVHEVIELPLDKTHRIELPIIPEPELEPALDLIPGWVERQKWIHIPWFSIAEICEWAERRKYKPWFSIEEEIGIGKKKICVSEIQRACAKHYGVTVNDIISARRTADVVLPRQVASYLAKKLTLCSLPELGRRFGGRDHTTQLSSIKKITRLIETQAGMRETVEHLAREVGGELE